MNGNELDLINQESKDFNASACPLSLAAGFIFQEPENLPVDNNHSTRPLTAREPVSQEDPEPESIQTSPASIQALPTLLAPAPESLVVENAPATPRSINGNKLRTNIFDKPNLLDSQRERADKGSILKIGIKNKRWKDLADYRKFENYVPEWVRLHPELVLGGQTALETQRGI